MSRLGRCCLLALALGRALQGQAMDPAKPLTQLRLSTWNSLDQGLPQTMITAVAQGREGYIWIGTQQGLACFDGVRFTRFDMKRVPQLRSNWMTALLPDREGRLWIGTEGGGITCLQEGRFRTWGPKEGLPGQGALALAEDALGRVWAGTLGGIARFDGGLLVAKDLPGLPEGRVQSLACPAGGQVYAGTREGLYLDPGDGAFHRVDLPPDWGRPDVTTLARDPQGGIVGVLRGTLVFRIPRAGPPEKLDLGADPGSGITSLLVDAHGNLWVGTLERGLLRAGSGGASRLEPRQGLADPMVLSLCLDRSGTLWVGTQEGLHSLREADLSIWSAGEEPELRRTWSIHQDGDGGLWVGTEGGLFQRSGQTWRRLEADAGFGASVNTVFRDAKGTVWVGGKAGLGKVQGSRIQAWDLGTQVKGRTVTVLYQDRQGGMWIGTKDGAFEVVGGEAWALGSLPLGAWVKGILEDREGSLWMATNQGLFRKGRGDRTFKAVPELAATPQAQCLFEDSRGVLWIGTRNGLYRHRGGRYDLLTTDHGLREDLVLGLQEDLQGNLWLHQNLGLSRLPLDTLEAATQRRDRTLEPLVFPYKPAEGDGGRQPLGCLTRDGRLWFATSKGVALIDTGRLRSRPTIPPVRIEEVLAEGKEVKGFLPGAGGECRVPPGPGRLEFHYAGLELGEPETVRFRYRLEHFHEDWVEAGPRRTAFYTNVPPGHYRFQVRAYHVTAPEEASEATFDFQLEPRFFQTRWFLFACLMGAAGSAGALARVRVLQVRARESHLKRLVAERTQDLQERNQELEGLTHTIEEINRELELGPLLDAILHHIGAQYPQVDQGVFLLRDIHTGRFHYRAAMGVSLAAFEGVSFDREEALQRYTGRATALAEGVFEVREFQAAKGAERLQGIQVPPVVMAMPLFLQGDLEGFLVLGHPRDGGGFTSADAQKLLRFREHAISAIAKARTLEGLKAEKEKAEEATRAKSQFLANMSHEIRTPMNAIQGFALLGLRLELPPKPKDYFQKIATACQALLGVVNDILDFSKIEAGKLELEMVPFQLSHVLANLGDLFASKAAEKDIELILSPSPHLPPVLIGDPLRLGQVLTNLVSNAIKFTERGQVLVKVEPVRAPGAGTVLAFTVSDSGIGMSEKQLSTLFEAFQQADSSMSRRFGGTGLGLVITRRLVALMGGEIQVRSQPGQGSTFTFTAVLRVPEDVSGATARMAYELLGVRVLVVDDNAVSREVLAEQLRAFGMEPRTAPSGQAALDLLAEPGGAPFALVLLDWKMPGLDGLETARRIHQHQGLEALPTLIMVTAFGGDELRHQAPAAGIQGYLQKPVTPGALREAILRALRPQKEAPLAPSAGVETSPRLAAPRVLLVEDNPINQEVAGEILRAMGVRLDIASSGLEALRRVDQARYDAVLMDIQMPDMDGYETTARLRERPVCRDLPIIAMTAHAMAGYREECLAAGMNDYISKPIEPDVLFEVLSRWTRRSDLAAAPSAPQDPPAAPERPLLDRPGALRRLGGNEALLDRLLEEFRRDQAGDAEALRQALEAGDLGQAERIAHTLKGVAGNLGAKRLQEAAAGVEKALRAGDAPAAREGLEGLAQALAATLEALRGQA